MGDVAGGALVTVGNAVLTGGQPGLGGALSQAGANLQKDGLAGLPVVGPGAGQVVSRGDAALNPVAKVVVADAPLLGPTASGTAQLVGVSALSHSQTQGSLATAGVLSSGQPLTNTGQLATVQVGETTVLGGGPTPSAVAVNVLAPSQNQGAAATVGVLTPASGVGSAAGAVTGAVGAVVNGGTGAVGGLVSGVTGGLSGAGTGNAGAGLTGRVGGLTSGLVGGVGAGAPN